ncbi:fumarylacetoacetate hydrolase family protein [bacterium]|nr:fumarylacetoacetate hydrolase family protein [bacterium]
MKFCSFKKSDGQKSWGILGEGGRIAEATALAPTLLDWLRGDWSSQNSKLKELAAKANIEASSVTFDACIPNPPSMRDGYAFRQHVEAARKNRGVPMIPEYDDFPIFYFTNHQAVVGPGSVKLRERHFEKFDFELEAAIVVGKKGRDIAAKDADDYIFGYTIMNDFSARALQMEEMKLNLGPAKGKDFATALGPWLVTRDELEAKRIASSEGERFDLEMSAVVNDKPISKGNMKDMTFTFAQILERVSYGVDIFPGDVIGSGTVGTGCFLELNGSGVTNQWMNPGDQIVLKIDQLGELRNSLELYEP